MLGIIALIIGLYCKCFQNRMSCVCKHTRPNTPPTNNTHIELQPIVDPIPDISGQLSPQLVQEILKASGIYICQNLSIINGFYIRSSLMAYKEIISK